MARLARNTEEKHSNKKKSFLLYLLVGINLALTIYLYLKIGII